MLVKKISEIDAGFDAESIIGLSSSELIRSRRTIRHQGIPGYGSTPYMDMPIGTMFSVFRTSNSDIAILIRAGMNKVSIIHSVQGQWGTEESASHVNKVIANTNGVRIENNAPNSVGYNIVIY